MVWWLTRRWWFALIPALAISLQAAIFVTASSVIGRARPDVPHLDPAPPTPGWDRAGRRLRGRRFLGGLAEGAETIVVHSLWLLLPAIAWQIALVWAAVVALSSVQRIVAGYRALS